MSSGPTKVEWGASIAPSEWSSHIPFHSYEDVRTHSWRHRNCDRACLLVLLKASSNFFPSIVSCLSPTSNGLSKV
ncbi:hypothetical protein M404DRAFT_1004538, partial [Pisolithus tinctorius Marx 270]